MKANVGRLDRIVRIAIGLVLLSLIVLLPGPERWWGLLGVIPLATASLSFCPLYSLLGISSCPVRNT
ncbi:MAG: DUF2892 domain-containing protein [Xanthomonadaceae bacterium]|nr:DUF2892 domain-containing protein [Xanthomonadaceae bacterium]MDE1958562.1 DUF2892 domain-containing protein [Xanthomonadaceae bacterium]MDE2177699.1 DUF2892 domain-containing protein [Xanthomonadaceae bacterium]MDE2246167.1 DUF2892 domain-containing protein [Xanthomonadaceae bacterium]